MNKQHQSFLLKCITNFKLKFTEKFLKGCKEHKGNLFDLSIEQLLEEALQENYDQYCFLMAIKEKLEKKKLDEFQYHKDSKAYTYQYPPQSPTQQIEKYIPKIIYLKNA
jgi:hypothetical protein